MSPTTECASATLVTIDTLILIFLITLVGISLHLRSRR
jgi:hypothetical protein